MKGGGVLLLKRPSWAVSVGGELEPLLIVMQTPPGTLVFTQPT